MGVPISWRSKGHKSVVPSSSEAEVSTRTKHVYIRYRFVQEYVLDGFLEIIFVGTKMNDADIFTKNLGGDLYNCHSRKIITEKGKI